MTYLISRNTVFPLMQNLLNLKVKGKNNIETGENYLFASNHLSFLDVPLLISVLAPLNNHRLNTFLDHRFYNHPLLWPLAKIYGLLKIDMDMRINASGKKLNDLSLIQGVKKLVKGNSVLIFPEGFIFPGRINKVIRGYTGVIRLAIQSKTNITPIGITGTNKVYPVRLNTENPFKIDLKKKIVINIGKQFNLEKYFDLNLDEFSVENKKILRKLVNELMQRISELNELEYDPDVCVNRKTKKLIKVNSAF